MNIALLSAPGDAHHDRIAFLNFFERGADRGALTWRTIRYEDCRAEHLAGCDLVVFSRPRFREVPALLGHCRAAATAVLVMIDDNWIAAGREYPRFEALFTPGRPPFEIFLDAVRRADAVLVFNEVLAEDMMPWASRVLRLPATVNTALFTSTSHRAGGFLAGYAGSPRWESSGFRGLARFFDRRDDVGILVMAHEVPEDLRTLSPARLTFVPWQDDYVAYARRLTGFAPDVLIAPLEASRFSASKIPIKFLESAAVGAAGVYSRVRPYTDHVRDGETGLLVDNREDAWADALERLYADVALRRRLAANARRHVLEHFDTQRVLPAFLTALQDVVTSACRR